MALKDLLETLHGAIAKSLMGNMYATIVKWKSRGVRDTLIEMLLS